MCNVYGIIIDYYDRLRREELPRISKETGLHIVAGTAFYVDPLTPEKVKLMTIEEVG